MVKFVAVAWLFLVGLGAHPRGGILRTYAGALGSGGLSEDCPAWTYTVDDLNSRICGNKALCTRPYSNFYCDCEAKCDHFGDCCMDAPSRGTSETKTDLKCQPTNKQMFGYYMTGTCPDEYPDAVIRSLCEESRSDDYLLRIPVTDTGDKTLFRNLYCAICHERAVESLYFWKFNAECPLPKSTPTPDDGTGPGDGGNGTAAPMADAVIVGDGQLADSVSTSESEADGSDRLSISTSEGVDDEDDTLSTSASDGEVDEDGELSVSTDDAVDVESSISASDGSSDEDADEPAEDDDIKRLVEYIGNPECRWQFEYRLERSNTYRKCIAIDVTDFVSKGGQSLGCPTYLSPYQSGGTIYRNRECAACNMADVSQSTCDALPPEKPTSGQGTSSYANLFLFRDGYTVSNTGEKRSASCGSDEIYDPFSRDCRAIVARSAPLKTDIGSDLFTADGRAHVAVDNGTACSSHDDRCLRTKELITSSVIAMVSDLIPGFRGSFDISDIECVDGGEVTFCSPDTELLPSNKCDFKGSLVADDPDEVRDLLRTSSPPSRLKNETLRQQGCKSPSMKMDMRNLWVTSGNASCKSLNIDAQAPSVGFVWLEEKRFTEVLSIDGPCIGRKGCDTEIAIFSHSEFTLINDTHVLLQEREQIFGRGAYYHLQDGSVGICTDLLDMSPIESKDVEDILTIIGASLSIPALAATAATYILLSRLRNNMGRSILSLVLSLLVAQVFQIALWGQTSNSEFCTFVAIVSHYAYLATFFWTNVLGFDLSRTFGNRSKMQTVRDSRKVFFYFSSYAWGGPMVIVAVCIGIHFGAKEEVSFWYGDEHICWIGNHLGLLLAFGIPVAVILLLDVIFFIDTVVGILRARNATKRATSSNPDTLNRDRKTDFLLFCKLSCIMGLTWLFGFMVPVFPKVPAVLYIFIVLNSTLGVYIFIAFGLNPRVIEMWRTGYSKRRLAYSRSNSLAVTAKTSVSSVTGHQIRQVNAAVAKSPGEIRNPTYVA